MSLDSDLQNVLMRDGKGQVLFFVLAQKKQYAKGKT